KCEKELRGTSPRATEPLFSRLLNVSTYRCATSGLARNSGMIRRPVTRRRMDVAVGARGCLSRGRDAGFGGVEAGLEAGLKLHEQIEHRLGLALQRQLALDELRVEVAGVVGCHYFPFFQASAT